TPDERHPVLIRGIAALRRRRHELLVERVVLGLGFLEERLVLLRRRCRPVLSLGLGRNQCPAEHEGEEAPNDTFHGRSLRSRNKRGPIVSAWISRAASSAPPFDAPCLSKA